MKAIKMSKAQIFLHTLPLFLVITLNLSPLVVTSSQQEEAHDRITALPGQPKVSFQQFSGYVTVNQAVGRALFYWLTEATTLPLSKPLVVWLNGGPGCSSVAYGASEEIGPFRINRTASGLHLNKFSWNSVANLLFLETPAGVGFSYSNRSADLLDTGDRRTAKDSLAFLIRWLERFPRYKGREVYITGESYAGHYVPQLAREIMIYNSKSKHPINLKGIMVGNAVTDNYYDNLGTVTYWWSHAMISDKTYRQLINTCDFRRQKESDECESLYSYAMDQEFGNIDQYNIYAPPCNNSDGSTTTRQTIRLPHRPHKILRQISGYDPCTENGDVDSVVPVTATRYSLAQLKLTTKIPWYPWYVKKQVGGWTEVYEGLTFATVRGAGHEVPLFKPRAALQLFKSFLRGEPLPRS
ncbi:hypothetical protein Pint_19042 [Pistacia integerrima]|uniref:Uncharacterized protein n=1 Tax=Pistacia integerrima TaxID=434235 RepID=A0ACC0YYW5_9ROSI|nr:hypothetical protein Pint_19042 [Pistacia integerrima]